MRVEPEQLHYHAGVANVGTFLSGANNNGAHSPNGITAMFIATGQDVANVAESSAGIVYTELTAGGRPLHVAHHPVADRRHLRRRHRPRRPSASASRSSAASGAARCSKFAEIVAGVALAGEISLASAISSLDWVSSHEKYGRNR